MYDLSFERLSSFLILLNQNLVAEENGKTFRQLIDLGSQFKSVKGDAFYYAWFKYLLDSALSLLANHPDQGLVEALRVSIEDQGKGEPLMILTSALHGAQGDVCLELFVCVDLDCCGE
jgi:hypothetical protein